MKVSIPKPSVHAGFYDVDRGVFTKTTTPGKTVPLSKAIASSDNIKINNMRFTKCGNEQYETPAGLKLGVSAVMQMITGVGFCEHY